MLTYKNIDIKRTNFHLNIKYLQLEENKLNMIVGDNGSGKSTLAKALIAAQDKYQKKVLLRQDSIVFRKSVIQNIKMVLRWNNSSKNPEEYLEVVGLLDKKATLANNLSGGEKKRLAFGMALATESDFIILDEPFINIDNPSKAKLLQGIKSYLGTLVIITHSQEVIDFIGDNFIILSDGKLIFNGSRVDFFANQELKNIFNLGAFYETTGSN